jgi:hypothetical protein
MQPALLAPRVCLFQGSSFPETGHHAMHPPGWVQQWWVSKEWCKWASWLGSCVSRSFHQCTPQLLGELFCLQPCIRQNMFISSMYLVCTAYVLVCTHHESVCTSIGQSEMTLQHLPHCQTSLCLTSQGPVCTCIPGHACTREGQMVSIAY